VAATVNRFQSKETVMTIRTNILSLGIVFATALASVASAQSPLPLPKVEYSADRVVESSAGTVTGKFYGTPDKERAETLMGGVGTLMITRRDKEVTWNLMPIQKMYMETKHRAAREQTTGMPADVTVSQVGPETVEGVATTKYKVLMKDGTAGGFMWFTAEGIMLKMDGVQKDGKDSSRMTITLKNLQIGPQDPELFEVPSDYTKMPGGMAFGGMVRNPAVKENPAVTDKDAGKDKDPRKEGVTDAAKDAAKDGVKDGVKDGIRSGVGGAIKGGIRGVFRH
jgi:hypothetical protein